MDLILNKYMNQETNRRLRVSRDRGPASRATARAGPWAAALQLRFEPRAEGLGLTVLAELREDAHPRRRAGASLWDARGAGEQRGCRPVSSWRVTKQGRLRQGHARHRERIRVTVLG